MKKGFQIWLDNDLWHYKSSKYAMTRLYRSKAHMLAENPEIPEWSKMLRDQVWMADVQGACEDVRRLVRMVGEAMRRKK